MNEQRSLATLPLIVNSFKKERAIFAEKVHKTCEENRKICADSGLSYCFFNNFASWSDYVHGRIGEGEFIERTKWEAAKMGQDR